VVTNICINWMFRDSSRYDSTRIAMQRIISISSNEHDVPT